MGEEQGWGLKTVGFAGARPADREALELLGTYWDGLQESRLATGNRSRISALTAAEST